MTVLLWYLLQYLYLLSFSEIRLFNFNNHDRIAPDDSFSQLYFFDVPIPVNEDSSLYAYSCYVRYLIPLFKQLKEMIMYANSSIIWILNKR